MSDHREFASPTGDMDPQHQSSPTADPERDPLRAKAWPQIVVVASGKGGVGKTTVATNLAVTFSSFGRRVALLDACHALGDVATLLGLDPDYGLDALLRGQRSVNDILVAGPAGVLVLPSPCGSPDLAELTNEQEARLWQALLELGDAADLVVVDAPAGLGASLRSWLHRADDLVVVTTADPAALTNAYALMKMTARLETRARIHVVANDVANLAEGTAIHDRLRAATLEFLGVEVEALAVLPRDPCVGEAARRALPFVISAPSSAPSQGIRRAARRILSQLTTGTIQGEVVDHSVAATAVR